MQTFLVHEDIIKSAEMLDPERRFSQIYEGIHILASNMNLEHKLITRKRSIANHPTALLWKGYEAELYMYTFTHYLVWYQDDRKTSSITINGLNLELLSQYITKVAGAMPPKVVARIPEYRALLLNKDPVYYSKFDWSKS